MPYSFYGKGNAGSFVLLYAHIWETVSEEQGFDFGVTRGHHVSCTSVRRASCSPEQTKPISFIVVAI